MKRVFGVASLIAVLSACEDGSSSSSPTPTTPTPTTPTPAQAYRLSGVVRAGGVPLAGAKVGLVKFGVPSPGPEGPFVTVGAEDLIAAVVTDQSGSYTFPTVSNVSFSGALVSVSQSGYFTDTKYILMSDNRELDFDLEPAVYITVGQVIQSQIGAARCASFGYGGMGGAACQRFALTVPESGTLEVRLSIEPVQPFDLSVLRPDGTIAVYNASSSSPVRVRLVVTAGLTYQIDAVHASAAARAFELTTTLR
jgi:hypothetical protein